MGESINRNDAEQDQRLSLLELRMKAAESILEKMSVNVDRLSAATENLRGVVDSQRATIMAINAVTVLAIVGYIIKSLWG